MNLRRHLIRLAETISRKTYFLDGLKTRLGISQFVLKILAPPVSTNDRAKILSSLDKDYISRKIQKIVQCGHVPSFWILLTHSMGDIVACEPIARYLKGLVPNAKIGWIVKRPFRELIENNPYIDSIMPVESLAEGKDFAAQQVSESADVVIVDCHFDGTSCPKTNRIFANPANPDVNIHTYLAIGSLLETYSLAAGLPPLTDAPIFHFSKSSPPIPSGIKAGYVVFHCRSADPCKDWPSEKWNSLADKLAETGRQIVEIGTERVLEYKPSAVIDFTGYRNLQQIASIIKGASLFVGVDSVFAHVANAVQTPSVILLGKYRNFMLYFPYIGAFSHSKFFQILRAPSGQPAAKIETKDVFACIAQLYDRYCKSPVN